MYLMVCMCVFRLSNYAAFKEASEVRAKASFDVDVARIKFERAYKAAAIAVSALKQLKDEKKRARDTRDDQQMLRVQQQINYQRVTRDEALKSQEEEYTHLKSVEATLGRLDKEYKQEKKRYRSSEFFTLPPNSEVEYSDSD